jgi:hypothetical protein
MFARRLEFVPDQPQAQQKHAEVIACALSVEGSPPALCRSSVQRSRANRQHQLDVGLDLAGVQRALEPSELNRPAIPDVMKVEAVVACGIVVVWLVVMETVPDGIQFVSRSRTLTFDLLDQLRTDWFGVAREPLLG